MTAIIEPIISRRILQKTLDRSSETIRRMIHAGKIPPPDIDLSFKTRGWRVSTLEKAGIKITASDA